ncbi:MAG: MFS transporter [Ottowia sp.]|nr:MFS transporter [Ottowia sp.]
MHDLASPSLRVSRSLTQQDYRTLSLASLGGTLEYYDFIIFVFFAAVISDAFFPPTIPEWLRLLQTFGIFAAGNLARPLGGIVMAHFGDMLGRKRMFALSIALMVFPTLGIGLLPDYASIGLWAPIALLCLRILQGVAVGGEVPGAWVFVSEHVPEHRVGYACSLISMGFVGGILLGSLSATLINSFFTPDQVAVWGWRLPFLLGALLGLVAIYLRRWLQETPVFLRMQAEKKLAKEMPLKVVLKNHRAAVVTSMLMTCLLCVTVIVVALMTPTYLQKQLGVTAALALRANSIAIIAMMVGCVIAGWIIDRIGSGWTMLAGSTLLGTMCFIFYSSIVQDTTMLHPLNLCSFYALTGLSVGVVGAIPSALVRSFPPAVRFSGLSFSYNVAYALVGGITPLVISWWLKSNVMALAHYIMIFAAIGIAVGIYLLFLKPKLS